jgi:hypothetical protein
MGNVQREILEAYEETNRAALACPCEVGSRLLVKSEADFWSDLASKRTATRNVPGSPEDMRGIR